SIVAYKLAAFNVYGVVTDGGNNISSDITPTFSVSTSTNNVDPKLLALANYGGLTKTFALQTNSPAIDKGDSSVCPPADLRGDVRTNTCDIGDFAFNGVLTPVFLWAGGPAASEDGVVGIFTIYRTNNTNIAVTVNYSVTGTA